MKHKGVAGAGGKGRTAPEGNHEGVAKIGILKRIYRLLGAAKLQSAPCADNPRYATVTQDVGSRSR